MTEQQKNAFRLLNRLQSKKHISEEEYFTLLEFVIGENVKTETYIPYWGEKPYTIPPDITYTDTNGVEKGNYPQCELKDEEK